MEIREILMEQKFSIANADPYLLSLSVMEELSKDFKVLEKKNTYQTDGPRHVSTVNFDTIEVVDDFSKIVFRFELLGEDGELRANVKGVFDTKIIETGFFSNNFSEYYMKNLFPLMRKISEDRIIFFSKKIEGLLNNN